MLKRLKELPKKVRLTIGIGMILMLVTCLSLLSELGGPIDRSQLPSDPKTRELEVDFEIESFWDKDDAETLAVTDMLPVVYDLARKYRRLNTLTLRCWRDRGAYEDQYGNRLDGRHQMGSVTFDEEELKDCRKFQRKDAYTTDFVKKTSTVVKLNGLNWNVSVR